MKVMCKRDAIEDRMEVGKEASVLPYIVRGQVHCFGNVTECNAVQRSSNGPLFACLSTDTLLPIDRTGERCST